MVGVLVGVGVGLGRNGVCRRRGWEKLGVGLRVGGGAVVEVGQS